MSGPYGVHTKEGDEMRRRSTFPFADLRVLDFSRVLAGPYCCMLLGSMGAEVIKIERPGTGDESRAYGQLWHGVGLDYLNVNRSKRGMTLNLADPRGQEIARRLLRTADVLVENFVPGRMEGFGLGYERAREENERLIYCSVSAYGDHGPRRTKPGYDSIVQGFSGHMMITGEAGGGPVRAGASVVDLSTGLTAYAAIVTALMARQSTGVGQRVSVSLLHTALALLGTHGANFLNTGVEPERAGSGVGHLAPYRAYATADGYVVIGAQSEASWTRLCEVLGRSELAKDPRFVTLQDRIVHRAELDSVLEPIFVVRATEYWTTLLDDSGVVVGPVNSVGRGLTDPQVAANGFVELVEGPDDGLEFVRPPMQFDAWPKLSTTVPPTLGQDEDGVLAELNYDRDDIADLRAGGVIQGVGQSPGASERRVL